MASIMEPSSTPRALSSLVPDQMTHRAPSRGCLQYSLRQANALSWALLFLLGILESVLGILGRTCESEGRPPSKTPPIAP